MSNPGETSAPSGESRLIEAGPMHDCPADTAEFFDKAAPDWAGRYTSRPSFQERLRAVGAIIEPILGRTSRPAVLDYGGGAGVFAALCARHGGFVVNLDGSLAMLRSAPADAAVHRVAGTLDALSPKADRRFDLVLAIAVLEYLDRPDLAVARLSQVLAVGGSLVLTVPREQSWLRRLERRTSRLTTATGRTVGIARLTERGYTRLRPHGDRVAWQPPAGEAVMRMESAQPVALGPTGLRQRIRPNLIVVLRRTE